MFYRKQIDCTNLEFQLWMFGVYICVVIGVVIIPIISYL